MLLTLQLAVIEITSIENVEDWRCILFQKGFNQFYAEIKNRRSLEHSTSSTSKTVSKTPTTSTWFTSLIVMPRRLLWFIDPGCRFFIVQFIGASAYMHPQG